MLKRLLTRRKKGGVPLYLNVYNIAPINRYLYWVGLGFYHSAVEAHGVEYAFGGHEFSSSGIFAIEPGRYEGIQLQKRVKLGTIHLDSMELRDFMVQLSSEYGGSSYNLIVKNCNHFCNDVSLQLTGSSIPGWVNRLAKLGYICMCFLPIELNTTTIDATPGSESNENSTVRSNRLCLAECSVKKKKRKCQRVSSLLSSSSQSAKGKPSPWRPKLSTFANQIFEKL